MPYPTDLAVIDIALAGVRRDHQGKLFDLYQAVGGRPVAILDDEFGGKDPDHAHHRTPNGAPTLLVPVNPHTALRRADIDTVRTWPHLAAPGRTWPHLAAPGRTWPHLAAPGRTALPKSAASDARNRPCIGPTSARNSRAAAAPRTTGGRPRRGAHLPQEATMTSMSEPDDDTQPPLSVGDPDLGKTRLLARQCGTCIFHPGNRMHLAPGRLKQMVDQALTDGSYVICHDTLPYGNYPEMQPAICRGFADRYTTWRLQVITRLFGFIEVLPPEE